MVKELSTFVNGFTGGTVCESECVKHSFPRHIKLKNKLNMVPRVDYIDAVVPVLQLHRLTSKGSGDDGVRYLSRICVNFLFGSRGRPVSSQHITDVANPV